MSHKLKLIAISDREQLASEELRELFQSGGSYTHHFAVHFDNDEVGLLLLDFGPLWKYLFLYSLYLVPERRSQGIGTKLMPLIEDIARENGCQEIILKPNPLGLNPSNPLFPSRKEKLIRFYRRCGYKKDKHPDQMRKSLL